MAGKRIEQCLMVGTAVAVSVGGTSEGFATAPLHHQSQRSSIAAWQSGGQFAAAAPLEATPDRFFRADLGGTHHG
jgi:hypothetical protein